MTDQEQDDQIGGAVAAIVSSRPDSPHPSVASLENVEGPVDAPGSIAATTTAEDASWQLRIPQTGGGELQQEQEHQLSPSSSSLSAGAAPQQMPARILWSELGGAIQLPPAGAAAAAAAAAITTTRGGDNNDAGDDEASNADSFRTTWHPSQRTDSFGSQTGVFTWRRRFRTFLRCICFPVMILMTVVSLCLFFFFVVFPFVIFLAGLLTVYYCCTSDPIPFRTLLRAMVGVEDWNGGAFDNFTPSEPYNVTKEDIRKGIIRRLCLGPMEWTPTTDNDDNANTSKVASGAVQNNQPADEDDANKVGGDLSTLPRDYPGRVHWKNEASAITCLVFSEPLGSSPSVSEQQPVSEDDSSPPLTDDNNNDNAIIYTDNDTDATIVDETLESDQSTLTKIPKYLQRHDTEKGAAEIEDNDQEVPSSCQADGTSVEGTVPGPTGDLSDRVASEAVEDTSSVRDRGTVCDICLLEFETGEAVAWSKNTACDHAYHEECITDWLLRKPTCPSCRQNFIILPAVREHDGNNNNDNSLAGSGSDSSSEHSDSSSESSGVSVLENAPGMDYYVNNNNNDFPSNDTDIENGAASMVDTNTRNDSSDDDDEENGDTNAATRETTRGNNGLPADGDIELGAVNQD